MSNAGGTAVTGVPLNLEGRGLSGRARETWTLHNNRPAKVYTAVRLIRGGSEGKEVGKQG